MRLVQHKFAAWLRAKQPDAIVGENRDCHSCPIANFYSETSGGADIVIFDRGDDFRIDRGDGGRPAPRWASQFIDAVDGDQDGKITARRALQILDEIS